MQSFFVRSSVLTLLVAALAGCAAPGAAPAAKPQAINKDDAVKMVRATANQMSTIDNYRVAMELSLAGVPGLPSVPGTDGPTMNIEGTAKSQDTDFTVKGLILTLLGADPLQGVHVMHVGNRSYIHGPIATLGATEDKWYILPPEQQSTFEAPFRVNTLLDPLKSDQVDFSGFNAEGEAVDGQQCARLFGNGPAVEKFIRDLNSQSQSNVDTTKISNAEMSLTVCPDNYLHKLSFSGDAANPSDANKPVHISAKINLSNFGTNPAITAPADAAPLTAPNIPAVPLPIDTTPTP